MKKTSLFFIIAAAMAAVLLTACSGNGTAASQDAPPADSIAAGTADAETPSGAAESLADAGAISGTDEGSANAEMPDGTGSINEAGNTDAAAAADTELTNDSIGPVSFTPNERGYSMVYGSNTLHAYFKRQNVIPGSGKMIIKKTSDDSVTEVIDLTDETKCSIGEQDSTFRLLGWDGGTHLIIRLKDIPASGESYYVNLEEGAFTSQDGTILSREVTDAATWCYGVANYGILPSLPNGSAVYVGDSFSADILVRQPAVLAKIENYDENRIRFSDKKFEKDGKVDIKIYQIGEDPFTVTFYDADDNPLGSITLSYTASMPPEPEEEAPQKSVTNL